MRKQIVLASGNKGKLAEFREILKGYDIVTPRELNIDFDVEETGETFFDNALIKAKALFALCGKPTLADDSGLCVNALDGRPGVFSARYSGKGDKANNDKLLAELADKTDRSAYFESCIVYYDGNEVLSATGRVYGKIANSPIGDNGFGYDPLFIPDELDGRTFGQAGAEQKNAISHRGRALSALFDILNDKFGAGDD